MWKLVTVHVNKECFVPRRCREVTEKKAVSCATNANLTSDSAEVNHKLEAMSCLRALRDLALRQLGERITVFHNMSFVRSLAIRL